MNILVGVHADIRDGTMDRVLIVDQVAVDYCRGKGPAAITTHIAVACIKHRADLRADIHAQWLLLEFSRIHRRFDGAGEQQEVIKREHGASIWTIAGLWCAELVT